MLGVKLTSQLVPITTGNGLGLETFTSSVFRKQRDRVLIFLWHFNFKSRAKKFTTPTTAVKTQTLTPGPKLDSDYGTCSDIIGDVLSGTKL